MNITRLSPTQRRLTLAAVIAGPVVTLAGMATTPWESEKTTAAYQAALAAHPTQGQIACVLLVFGYALLGLANFTVLRHTVAAPRVLRAITYVLCFFGATILPGMVLVDFYDLALATELPAAQGVAVADAAARLRDRGDRTAPRDPRSHPRDGPRRHHGVEGRLRPRLAAGGAVRRHGRQLRRPARHGRDRLGDHRGRLRGHRPRHPAPPGAAPRPVAVPVAA